MAVSRPNINFIEGAHIDIATVDNPGLEAVDVTITGTASGASEGDTQVWMPLTSTLTSVWMPLIDAVTGELVLDASGDLIPTSIPITGSTDNALVWDDDGSLIPTLVPVP